MLKNEQKQTITKETGQQRKHVIEGFITRSFNQAAKADNLAAALDLAPCDDNTTFVRLTARLPLRSLRDLYRRLTGPEQLPQPHEISLSDIEQNEAYRHYREELRGKGYEIKDIAVKRAEKPHGPHDHIDVFTAVKIKIAPV